MNGLSRPRLFVVVAGPLAALYLATASWSTTGSIDPFTNVLTARTIAVEGTVHLDDHAVLTDPAFVGTAAWVVEADGHAVSQYPPGAALHAVVPYLLWPGSETVESVLPIDGTVREPVDVALPPVGPSALTAALVAAVAVGLVGLTLRELVDGHTAALGAWTLGVATSTWTVAADELWQHGPAMLWLAVLGLAAARARALPATAGAAVAVLVRPLTGVVCLGTAVGAAVDGRRRAAVGALVGLAVGTAAVLAWSQTVFGSWSPSAGYDQTGLIAERNPVWILGNVGRGLLHPRYGLLVWSPFLLPLALGLREAWRAAPDWVRGGAAGGGAYLLAHWTLNRASGGEGYLYYRYPLEALVAASPLLVLAWQHGVRGHPARERALRVLLLLSVLGHAVASTR